MEIIGYIYLEELQQKLLAVIEFRAMEPVKKD
jgi:hypothetical protein